MTRKQIENRIQKAYTASCSGIQIPIMEVRTVWKAGERAIAAGASEEELQRALRTAADAVRTN